VRNGIMCCRTITGVLWYFLLTIQNTASRQVRNLFDLVAVFISFSGGTQSLAVRPRSAGSSDQLRASRTFPLKKKKKK
jgi:hypothetical protein